MSETVSRESALAYPPVAFSLELSAIARAQQLRYDIDPELIRTALLHAGVQEKDLDRPLVIIRPTTNVGHGGTFQSASDFNDDEPAIELFSFQGVGPISTKSAVHEGKHLADYLAKGEKAFGSRRAQLARKLAAIVCGVSAGAAIYVGVGGFDASRPLQTNLVELSLGLLGTHFLIGSASTAEYATRPHEIRARRAERRSFDENLLQVEQAGEPYHPLAVKQFGSSVGPFITSLFVSRYDN